MNDSIITLHALMEIYRSKGYLRYEQPSRLNLVGIRSKELVTGTFNDVIACFWKNPNMGQMDLVKFKGTTVAGLYYLLHPMNVDGTGILVEGNYHDSHAIGLHHGKYEAFVQVGDMKFYRDNNKDGEYDFDPKTLFTGKIGCNIHRANPEYESTLVNKWSAACMVVANPIGFDHLIYLGHEHEKLYGNKFDYTLLNEKDFL